MDDCIFCKIINGEIPSTKVYEDEKCVVLVDKFPLTPGQTLIIAKKHEDYLFDLDEALYSHCMLVAKRIAKATDAALGSQRCWMVVQGLEVAHNHIKILPMYAGKHIAIEEGTGKEISNEEMEENSKKIKKTL